MDHDPDHEDIRALLRRLTTALDARDVTLLGLTTEGETRNKRFAPPVEKALTFLDDTLLPSTSNAVERGNRRYRTRQKHGDRVRTQDHIAARLALDMWREAQGEGRHQTIQALHEARAG